VSFRKRSFIPIKEKPNRPRRIIASGVDTTVVFSYTISSSVLATYTTTIGDPSGYILMQPQGSVMAFNPDTQQIQPHFTFNDYTPVGVLLGDVIMDWGGAITQSEANVLVRGDVVEAYCWDNGVYGTVTAEAKAALGDRVKFVGKDVL